MAHKLHDPEPCTCRLDNFIDHDWDCAKYKNFFTELVETNDPEFGWEAVKQNRDVPGYLRAPLVKSEKGRFNMMCCCKSHLPHNESNKFILAGNETSHKMPIFPQTTDQQDGKIQRLNYKYQGGSEQLNPVFIQRDEYHWLFGREKEIHEILEFVLELGPRNKSAYFLAVTGPVGIGISTIITKAVHFSLERQFIPYSECFVKVESREITDIRQMGLRIFEALKLGVEDPTKETPKRQICNNWLVYIERSPSFDISNQGQRMLLDLCKNINTGLELAKTGFKVKFIVELGKLDSSILDNHAKLCRQFPIGELDKKIRLEFFKIEVESLKLKSLLTKLKQMIESKKFHPLFEKFQTDVLEKIAWRIDEEESKDLPLEKVLDKW